MSFSADTLRNIAFKKLFNRTHSQNSIGLATESINTNITVANSTIFGESIPSVDPNITSNFGYDSSGLIQKVQFTLESVTASNESGKFHAYAMKLPNSTSLHSSIVSHKDTLVHASLGKVQLVPPSFGSDPNFYKPVVLNSSTQEITYKSDKPDYIDYFSGVYYREDITDDSRIPHTVTAYVYVGKMVDSVAPISSAEIDGNQIKLTLSNGDEVTVNGSVVGPAGSDGTQGTTGVDGSDGISITSASVNGSGELVLTLSDSSTLNAGTVKGADGSNGAAGSDGVSVSTVALTNDELIITLSDSTVNNLGNVKGATGSQGPVGQNGTNGTDGQQGVKGETGDTGLQGGQGIQGVQGATGTGITFKGNTASTTTLNAISNPTQGDAYLVDEDSNNDKKDLHIYDGSGWVSGGPLLGPQGIQGEQGTQGATGVPGSQGIQGQTGSTGTSVTVSSVTNNSNDTITIAFSDGTNHTTATLKGNAGTAGAQGIQGATGDTGPSGAADIVDASTIATDKVWSTSVINTKLAAKADTSALPANVSDLTNDSAFITGYTVTQSDVTAQQAHISITESQISDFGTYETADATILKDADIDQTVQAYDSDYAALKTKVGTIETNAKDDQTAQEIVTLIDADTTAEASLKTALGLDTAAYTATSDYATAAQGVKADSALQAHPSVSAANDSTNSGRTYIQSIGLDSNGHVTSIGTATETVVNTNTTYSAASGGGLSVSNEEFSITNSITAGTLNDDAKTVNLSFNSQGMITAATLQDIAIAQSQVTNLNTSLDAKQDNLTFGIATTNVVKIDGSASDTQFVKFTANGVKGHTLSASDIGLDNVENQALSSWTGSSTITALGTIVSGTWQGDSIADAKIASSSTWNNKQNALTHGIADTNTVKIDDTDVADADYAKFTTAGLQGRSTTEVKSDLSLNNVENTTLSTWAGTSNITTVGTITTGTWEGTAIADNYIASANTWDAAVDNIGTLNSLTTTAKGNLVSAINELETNNNATQSAVDILETEVGTATLATIAQTITGAINELDSEINTVEASIGLTVAGAYQTRSGSNYIDSLSSVVAEATALDTQVKTNADNIDLLEIRGGGLFEQQDHGSSVYSVIMPLTMKISSHLGPFEIDMANIVTNNGAGDIIFYGCKTKTHEDSHFQVDTTNGDAIFTGYQG